jgi:MoaA/NifB/PqqE/SkfB family radical SAM enzyme
MSVSSESSAARFNWDAAKRFVGTKVVEQIMNYLEGNPDQNIPRLLKVIEPLAFGSFQQKRVRDIRQTYENNPVIREYFNGIFNDLDRNMRNRILCNFIIDMITSKPRREQIQTREGFMLPYAILIDPTSACNLKCVGCWAGAYAKHDELEPELFDRILGEAKELGITTIVLSGGEPFVYPHLLDVVGRHTDLNFMCYTNGTRIDDAVADRLNDLGNFSPAISIEGWREQTDARRGEGTFDKIVSAFDRLKERRLFFGASLTVTSHNVEAVSSEEFIDFLIDHGVKYLWSFHYIPIGRQPDVSLMITPEQRAFLAERFTDIRRRKPLPIADFWNDGELTNGCIAGASSYFHINARGDVEPCAFAHFAVDNIREKSLLEVLRNPLFLEYQKRQPFSDNMLRPCPIIDHPHALREMVRLSGAHGTHEGAETLLEGEIAEFLDRRAAEWKRVSDPIWEERQKARAAAEQRAG